MRENCDVRVPVEKVFRQFAVSEAGAQQDQSMRQINVVPANHGAEHPVHLDHDGRSRRDHRGLQDAVHYGLRGGVRAVDADLDLAKADGLGQYIESSHKK